MCFLDAAKQILISYRLHQEVERDEQRPSHTATKDALGGDLEKSGDEKGILEKSSESDIELGDEEGHEPTVEEKQKLRRIGETLPFSTFLVAIVELCERFTYYGCSGVFQVR